MSDIEVIYLLFALITLPMDIWLFLDAEISRRKVDREKEEARDVH